MLPLDPSLIRRNRPLTLRIRRAGGLTRDVAKGFRPASLPSDPALIQALVHGTGPIFASPGLVQRRLRDCLFRRGGRGAGFGPGGLLGPRLPRGGGGGGLLRGGGGSAGAARGAGGGAADRGRGCGAAGSGGADLAGS
jgi:hypothetical protein